LCWGCLGGFRGAGAGGGVGGGFWVGGGVGVVGVRLGAQAAAPGGGGPSSGGVVFGGGFGGGEVGGLCRVGGGGAREVGGDHPTHRPPCHLNKTKHPPTPLLQNQTKKVVVVGGGFVVCGGGFLVPIPHALIIPSIQYSLFPPFFLRDPFPSGLGYGSSFNVASFPWEKKI